MLKLVLTTLQRESFLAEPMIQVKFLLELNSWRLEEEEAGHLY